MSTRQHSDEEMFFDEIDNALRDHHTQITILCDDFHAKIGIKENDSETTLEKFVPEGRNNRRETLLVYLLQSHLYDINSVLVNVGKSGWSDKE